MVTPRWHIEADPDNDDSYPAVLNHRLNRLHWQWGTPRPHGPENRLSLRLWDPGHSLTPSLSPGVPLRGAILHPSAVPAPDGVLLEDTVWDPPGPAWTKSSGTGGLHWQSGAIVKNGPGSSTYTVRLDTHPPSLSFRYRTPAVMGGSRVIVAAHNIFNYLFVDFGQRATSVRRFLYSTELTVRSGDPLQPDTEYDIEFYIRDGQVHLFANQQLLIYGPSQGNWNNARTIGIVSSDSTGESWSRFGVGRRFFQGFVDDAQQQGSFLQIEASDSLTHSDPHLLHTLIPAGSYSIGDLLNNLLSLRGHPPNHRRIISQGRRVSDRVPHPLWSVSVTHAIQDLVSENAGWHYLDGHGHFVFHQSRTGNSFSLGTAGLPASSLDSPGPLFPSPGRPPTRIDFYYPQVSSGSAGVIWELTQPVAVPADQSVSFIIEAPPSVYGFTAVSDPASGDFTANSNPNGSGTDITASIRVAVSTADYSGRGCLVTVANTGAVTAYLTSLTLKSSSIITFHGRVLLPVGEPGRDNPVHARFISHASAAQEAAQAILDASRNLRRATLELPLVSPANATTAAAARLGDRITLQRAGDDDAHYFITGQEIQWEVADNHIEATARLWLQAET